MEGVFLKRGWIFTFLWVFLPMAIMGQTVRGTFRDYRSDELALIGFDYFGTVELSSTTTDASGNFSLNGGRYRGMAQLISENQEKLLLNLDGTDIVITGNSLGEANSFSMLSEGSNALLAKVSGAYGQKEQAYSAWRFLQDRYAGEQVFPPPAHVLVTIKGELDRLEGMDRDIMRLVQNDAYLKWYVPLRKLVNNMPKAVNIYPERIQGYIADFRALDFNDPRFGNSGLVSGLIEGHFLLLENMGAPLDQMYLEMNRSIDYLLDNLQNNDVVLQKVVARLFDYFEKRSLFSASEHLATNVLNNETCSLDDRLAFKLESYRKLKVGNQAPDFSLGKHGKLSDMETTTLVVFGASGCPHCQEGLLQLNEAYPAWKDRGVEVVYFGIDVDAKEFEQAFGSSPWVTYTDLKGWDSPVVKEYCLFATPTYYLLDSDRTILLRPTSVAHAAAWILRNFDTQG